MRIYFKQLTLSVKVGSDPFRNNTPMIGTTFALLAYINGDFPSLDNQINQINDATKTEKETPHHICQIN
jgi:hypothetical protein